MATPLSAGALAGRTCIVTGATSGIGLVTARELARRGARVGLVARSREKAEAVRDAISRETGAAPPDVFLADLGVQAQVREVAERIGERVARIDVLVNNAGVVNLRRSTTPDGIETTFAVNHLAYFLLTHLLLDLLRAAAPGARIVNVASDAHRFVSGMNWDDPGFERGYRGMRVYGQSKLANLLFTAELARRLEGSGITVNAAHPGAVGTGLGTNNGALGRIVVRLLRPLFRTPEKGAETSIWLATAPELADTTGGYFADRRPHRLSAAARDPDAARRLWALSERLTGLAA